MFPDLLIKSLLPLILLGLSAPAHFAEVYQTRALRRVKKEIEVSAARKNRAPIQAVLKRYEITDAASFSGVRAYGDSMKITVFLPNKRPPKVTAAEWRALRNSAVEIEDSEDGTAEFSLLDLDEDGSRDLLVRTYFGGTGLFSYFYAYRQSGGRFVGTNPSASFQELPPGALYSVSGRGVDQQAEWLRIDGRIFLAFRSGEFGRDALVLRRAFSAAPGKMKGIVVEYAYRHTVPRVQKFYQEINGKKTVVLKPDFQATLQKAIARSQSRPVRNQENGFGECPVPQNATAEERERYAWPWFGTGHYSYDVLADFPVFEDGRCYAARLVNFKSSHLLRGRYVSNALWLLRRPGNEREEYEVLSERVVQSVKIADVASLFYED